MAVDDDRDLQPPADRIQQSIRQIQTDVLPRAERKIERSLQSVSASIGRQLESKQKLLDPER